MRHEMINGTTVLYADESSAMTNGATYGKEIWLSPLDTASNWYEISESEIPKELTSDEELEALRVYYVETQSTLPGGELNA
ncbi:hypothetical protein [Anaerotruncus rubiinfantis]|uniref:hypothetical protein n=1 Tax=Anaerotruncus rubiinfantis TaxID=1720200 RepID=UPI003D7A1166